MLRALLAAGLAIIATAAPAADYACARIKLTCASFEPTWSFVLPGNGTIRLRDPENPNNPANPGIPKDLVAPVCALRTSGSQIKITTGAPLSLTATVTRNVPSKLCNDESGELRPWSITYSYRQGALVNASGRLLSGTACCW
jgi:hypothetical protein